MLIPFKKQLERPDDIPNMPRATAEYLQVQFNAGFVMQMGTTAKLKAAGYSESYIAGFLAGLQMASQTIDDMEHRRSELID